MIGKLLKPFIFIWQLFLGQKNKQIINQTKCTKPINEVKTFDSYNIIIT